MCVCACCSRCMICNSETGVVYSAPSEAMIEVTWRSRRNFLGGENVGVASENVDSKTPMTSMAGDAPSDVKFHAIFRREIFHKYL